MKTSIGLAVVFLVAVYGGLRAAPITVDEIIYQDDVVNVDALSGTVDMTLSGNVLTITLTNTSGDTETTGAGNLLTGIGFELPSGVAIGSGDVNMGSSTAVNFTAPADGNVSVEYGYDNDPLDSGAFVGVATLETNTVVSTMQASSSESFVDAATFVPSDSLGKPDGSAGKPLNNLDGPDFGLLSGTMSVSDAGGQQAIQDSVEITLNLTGPVPADLLRQIQSGNVVLSFGSPDVIPTPEAGTFALFGAGLAGLGLMARRRRKIVA